MAIRARAARIVRTSVATPLAESAEQAADEADEGSERALLLLHWLAGVTAQPAKGPSGYGTCPCG